MEQALAFFGAFNPPTVAHLNLAELALRQTGGARAVFVPSQSVYIREDQGKDFAYSDGRRLAMLRAAAESRPWMAVSDWEIRQPRQPRTYETLCHLREEGCQAALLLGSDKLPELEHGWRYVPEIAREFGIVCLARGGDDVEAMLKGSPFLWSLHAQIQVLETPGDMKHVSSTAVRKKVAAIRQLRRELESLAPPEILDLLE